MIAYKFLRPHAVAPFSGTAWPVPANGGPGDWVESAGTLELCGKGVHACRVQDLPLWLFDELWQVELSGDVLAADTHLVASRGRLVARVEAWGQTAAADFAAACAERVGELARATPDGDRRARAESYAADAATWAKGPREDARIASADAACVAYIAAQAAGDIAGPTAAVAERAWQSAWLAARLGIE